jgi:DNA-binding NarL/FixJ family response regulator
MLRETDVGIFDLGLPDGYGGDLIRALRAANPRAQALVLSSSQDRAEIARAVESGAAGVLHKSAGMNEIIDAVRRLKAGETLLPLEDVVELLRFAGARKEEEYEAQQAIARLTDREREVLALLGEGLDAQQIAGRLHISAKTERNHVASILAKLGVHSRLQAWCSRPAMASWRSADPGETRNAVFDTVFQSDKSPCIEMPAGVSDANCRFAAEPRTRRRTRSR